MILIDSNIFVAYTVEDDSNHEKSIKVMEQIIKGNFGPAVTSDYIFDETTTVTLIRSKSTEKAVLVGNYIKQAIEILKINEDIFEDSWKMFKSQKSSKFSFTDCSNVSLMKERNIIYIATFDQEFKKVPFIRVLSY